MSSKSLLKSRAAAGTLLVALSGFVPQPLINSAMADTLTVPLTGSFISGITLSAGTNIQMGSMVASQGSGKAVLSTAGANVVSKGAAIGGAAAGTIKFKAVSTVPNVDITVSKMGSLTLGATIGGHAATGTAKLTKLVLAGIGAAAANVTAAGTVGKSLNYNINKTSGTIKVGATVTWGAVRPIGAFNQGLVFTIAY